MSSGPPPPARFAGSRTVTLLKVLVAVSILAWFAGTLDFGRLAGLASQLEPAYLALLLGLSFFRIAVSAQRFAWLTAPRLRLRFPTLVKQYFVAAFFNNLLPTALGGDAVRLFMLAREGLPKREGAVFIVAERAIGVIALVLLAVVGVLTFDVPAEVDLFVGLLAAAVVLALAGAFLSRPLLERWALRRPALADALKAALLLADAPRLLLLVLLSSLVFQVASIALSWVSAAAFGLDLPFTACLALVPLVWLATMLPISIGGIGIREIAFAHLLGTIGVSTEASLLVSLGTFAGLVVTGAVGGLLLLGDSVRGAPATTRSDEDAPLG